MRRHLIALLMLLPACTSSTWAPREVDSAYLSRKIDRARVAERATGTGVVVNGLPLSPFELAALEQVTGPLPAGRYRLDVDGDFRFHDGPTLLEALEDPSVFESPFHGYVPEDTGSFVGYVEPPLGFEGGYAPGAVNEGGLVYRSDVTDIGVGSSGGTSYVIGDGFSYISD